MNAYRQHIACLALIIIASLSANSAADEPLAVSDRNLNLRNSTANSPLVFKSTKQGHVAFIGGSITEMNGYRPIISAALQKQFPETKFTFTDAGIASTCSTTAAHRLPEDVFARGKVDLIFVEFAVNDDQDAQHARREAIRGMEGIIRQCRRHNPRIDIVVTMFVNEGMLDLYGKGKTPLSIEAHETVCAHYDVSSVNLAKEVSQLIGEGKLTWKAYGGVHPGPVGNALAARMCMKLLLRLWEKLAESPADYKVPAKPVDEGNYGTGHFIDPKEAKRGDGWTFDVPNWKAIPGSFRDRFGGKPVLVCTTPDATATLAFEGQAVGVYVLAGPDAGILEASIDGGAWSKVNLFHRFSGGLHYPRTVMLATDLKPGKHTLAMRVSAEHAPASKGTAARILKFAVN